MRNIVSTKSLATISAQHLYVKTSFWVSGCLGLVENDRQSAAQGPTLQL